MDKADCINFWKSGVPSPVAASQPTEAFHDAYGIMPAPSITIPFCRSIPPQPKEAPSVISFRLEAALYSQGLIKPMAGFPARKRASFSKAMMEATTGAAAEVPPLGCEVPFITVR